MRAVDVALLQALRAELGFSPAGELAQEAGVSLAVLEERLDGLRAAGFEIEMRPGLGCRLLSSPDRLIADDLWARMGENALVREIVVFEETDSTNERAADLGRHGAAPGVAIFAEGQTAGRGRFGRRWESRSHAGVWLSLLLRPALPMALWPRLTTAAAVGLAKAVETMTGTRALIKWPNDVLIDGRKVAGILVETGVSAKAEPFAVLGIGVNVNQERQDFPGELRERATSLREASGRRIDRPTLAVALLQELERQLCQLNATFPDTLTEAARRSSLLGRWVRLGAGDGVIEGMAESLDAEGHLMLRDVGGFLHRLSAGEVTVLAGDDS